MQVERIKPEERDYCFFGKPKPTYNRLEVMIELKKRTRNQRPWRPENY